MTFIDDIKFSKTYELETKKSLGNGDDIIVSQGKFKPYDLIDSNTGLKYEVKADKYYKTGNICVEFQCNNIDSGITSTESDFYYYYFVNTGGNKLYERLYIIPTFEIRKAIEKKKYHKQIKCGDGWRSQCYLFSENIFKDWCLLY